MAIKNLLKLKVKKTTPDECNKNRFSDMTKKEKKKFLSNDFIDRMIRVEQRVFSSFGEHIPYKETNYYLSLTKCEKKDFEKFYRTKKSIWKSVFLILFFSIVAISVFNVSFNGNVINETIGNSANHWISVIILVIMFISLLFVFLSFFLRRKKEKEFNSKFHVIDKIISSRRIYNKHGLKW
jgi:hypothetical protein